MSWDHMKGKPSPKRGTHLSEEHKEKLRQVNLKENPGYQAIHVWVRKWGGAASYCEMEDESCTPSRFEWSNISHEYKRDLNDYQQLCSSHHVRFDKAFKKKHTRELEAHLKVAKIYSELSYAKRLKVGCLLIKDGRVISIGRNGMPAGGSNICEVYTQDGPGAELVTKPEVVHAETNAIAYAARLGIVTRGCSMVITHSPCFECSKLIVQSGIRAVYYEKEYRLVESLDFLKKYNIKVTKI